MGKTFEERFEHLVRSFRKLLDRYRDYKKKGWGFNQFCKIDGAFYTTEYTYNETTKQWHPHIHIFALLTDWIDQEELAETWHDITLDSYIVDVRRVKKQKNTDTARQLQRYVNTLLNSAIYQWKIPFMLSLTLKGKRLTGSFGSMHGLKIEKAVPDEMLSDDIPYLEMLYRFVFGEKRSYYDLQVTKDVKPNKRNEEG